MTLKKESMGFVKEFKEFALKGNVIDLAIGVVIGGAFSKIVSSLVDDIITPAILTPALKAAHLANLSDLVIPGTAIKWGNFVANIISFIIVAIALFILVKALNAAKKKQDSAAVSAEPSSTDKLLMEIRDSLKK